MSYSMEPVQAQYFVWPTLDPNCLQRLSADDTSKHRVKHNKVDVVFQKVNWEFEETYFFKCSKYITANSSTEAMQCENNCL